MTPGHRTLLELVSLVAVTVVLGVFVYQGAPFLRGAPDDPGWPPVTATVVAKHQDSVDGRIDSAAVRHEIRFRANREGGVREGRGEISETRFGELFEGRTVEAWWAGRRLLLVEDLRWQPEHQKKYRLMAVATAVSALVLVHRVVRVLWASMKSGS